ncbi:hypothetical protein EPUL_001475 [Erysiphe pulchra]|uniref:Uncharacterized protein n=1 Tax=Erysiphe pulchra TaxID=225359 RepID=A0A2S4PXF8_9PEZI|nr:hypothetical protein EPUL_001475 [Erysiphe pulchra]
MNKLTRSGVPKLTLLFFDGDGQNADHLMAVSKISVKAEAWINQKLLDRTIMLDREKPTMMEVETFEMEFRSRFPGSLTASA